VAGQDELKRDSGVTIVTERRHHTVVIGAAIAILVAGAAAADANPYSPAKRIGVAAFFAAFIALCIVIWIGVNRRRNRACGAHDDRRPLRLLGGEDSRVHGQALLAVH
jgi:hypothetical protein